MWPNSNATADLATFTEEILNGKLHILCSVFAAHELYIPLLSALKLFLSNLFMYKHNRNMFF